MALPPLVLGEIVRAGTHDLVRTGRLGDRSGAAVLVTLTAPSPTRAPPRRLAFDGIAPLVGVGVVDGRLEALVEALPSGRPAAERVPWPAPALRRLGAVIADGLARVHAAGEVVDGIRPELVYVDADAQPTAIAPRGVAFIRGAPQPHDGCIRTYHVPFVAREVLLDQPPTAAADVFGLCATLAFLATGVHPFGDPARLFDLVMRMMRGDAVAPPVDEPIVRGLAAEPAHRPTAAELARALAR